LKANSNFNVCSGADCLQPLPVKMQHCGNTAADFAKPAATLVVSAKSTHQAIISPGCHCCLIYLLGPCSYARPVVKAVNLQGLLMLEIHDLSKTGPQFDNRELNAITFPHRQHLLWDHSAGNQRTQAGTDSITKDVSAHWPYVTAMLESCIQSEVAMKTTYSLRTHSPVDVAQGGQLCVQGAQPPPEQPARNQDLALPKAPFHQATPACHSYCKHCSGCVRDMCSLTMS